MMPYSRSPVIVLVDAADALADLITQAAIMRSFDEFDPVLLEALRAEHRKMDEAIERRASAVVEATRRRARQTGAA